MLNTMLTLECPWCAGPATVEVADGGEFSCEACAVHVEISPVAAPDTQTVGALAA